MSQKATQLSTIDSLISYVNMVTVKHAAKLAAIDSLCAYKCLLKTTLWRQAGLDVRTAGPLIPLEHPVDEARPLDDCSVAHVCPVWDPKSPNADPLIPSLYCPSERAGTGRSSIGTDLSTDLEMAACPETYQEEGQLILTSSLL